MPERQTDHPAAQQAENQRDKRAKKCSECLYWQPFNKEIGICRRHAPPPGKVQDQVAHWPETEAHERCGEGITKENAETRMVKCQDCYHWFQINPGQGLSPLQRGNFSVAWWREAGFCTRFAADAEGEGGMRIHWRAAHATNTCGDGEPKDSDDD